MIYREFGSKNQNAMEDCQAILVITLLTWAAVSVSGTTQEISTTTGDTVNIPCVFGDGMLRNIFWYYNDGTGPQKILFLSKGVLAIDPEYTDRASLQNDNLTLILKDIVVPDEGTYRCDVDRQGQTPVPNINTKLNVFSLRPDTLPVITPNCTWADEFSSCSIHANQFVTLTCTLPNVYPVEDTKLIWYQDGKHIPSTPDVTQNDDGTTNISEQIQVYETGNFTCNATYLSVNGTENTAASVIPPADVPYIPGKKMTTGQIVGMTIGIVLLVCISLAFIAFFTTRQKCSKAPRSTGQTPSEEKSPSSTQRSASEEPCKPSERPTEKRSKNEEASAEESSKLIERAAGNGSKNEAAEESSKFIERAAGNGSQNEAASAEPSKPSERPTEKRSKNEEESSKLIERAAENGSQNEAEKTSPYEETDFDDFLMVIAEKIPYDDINKLGKKLDFNSTAIEKYMATNSRHQNITSQGTLEMLRDWNKKQTKKRERATLQKALVDAGLVRLADEYFHK